MRAPCWQMSQRMMWRLQEYYLHALSGVRPHSEEGTADVEAQHERPSLWKTQLLSHASLPSANKLRSVPSAM